MSEVKPEQKPKLYEEEYRRRALLDENIELVCFLRCGKSKSASRCKNDGKCCTKLGDNQLETKEEISTLRKSIWKEGASVSVRRELLLQKLSSFVVTRGGVKSFKFTINGAEVCKYFFKVTIGHLLLLI
jgi:hypothetical protein